jgi:hypothetical protein
MKKSKLLILLLVAFLLTGCLKQEMNMKLETNNNFDITIINAVQKEYEDSSTISKDEYKNLGYTVEDYDDGEYIGIKAKASYNSIDEISSDKDVKVELTELVEKTNVKDVKLFKKSTNGSISTYTAHLTYDFKMNEEGSTSSDGSTTYIDDTSGYADSMELSFRITLPVKPVSSNATKTENDGLTQIWTLEYGKLNNIDFEFQIDSKNITKDRVEYIKETEKEEEKKEITPTEEVQEEQAPTKEEKQVNAFSAVVGTLLIFIVIFGFIALKIKLKKGNSSNVGYHKNIPETLDENKK